jgi:hypothetical protein
MKTTSLLMASATAITALSSPAVVSAAECNTASLVVTLLPLLFNSNFSTCQSDSGYTIFPYTGLPDATQSAAICASTACVALLEAAAEIDLPDCTITYDGTAYNVSEALASFISTCSA